MRWLTFTAAVPAAVLFCMLSLMTRSQPVLPAIQPVTRAPTSAEASPHKAPEVTIIYPDEAGKVTVVADIGAGVEGAQFGLNLDECGWHGLDGAELAFDPPTGKWRGQMAHAHKPGMRCTGRLGVGYAGATEWTFYENIPFSTEIGYTVGLVSPNVMQGDLLKMHMTITTTEGVRWQHGTCALPLYVHIDDVPGPEENLCDDGTDGDLLAGDGVFSGWSPVHWTGDRMARFVIWQWQVAEIPINVIDDPNLIVLTDLKALHAEFIDTGADPEEDRNGNMWLDFYEALDRIYEYAARHRGIVYDLGGEILTMHGYPIDYVSLDYAGTDKKTNRFRMAAEIDSMIAHLGADTGYSFRNIAIIGDDEVLPFHRLTDPRDEERKHVQKHHGNPTLMDTDNNYLMTDVPYSTYADDDPETTPSPIPSVALGRIFADHPDQLIDMIDSYDTPIPFSRGVADAAFFSETDDGILWEWFCPNTFIPIFEAHGLQRTYALDSPPTKPGAYYYWDPKWFDWRPLTVTHTISDTTLTVIYSHATHRRNHTEIGTQCAGRYIGALCAEHYDDMSSADQRVYVNAGCHGGYSISHYAADGDFGDYEENIANSLLEKHVSYLGNTVYGYGVNKANEWDDYLWSGYVNQLFNSSTETVGEAWLRAWPGYWGTASASDVFATAQAYGKSLYGLPTQPLEHRPSAVTVSEAQEAAAAFQQGRDTHHHMTLAVGISDFEMEYDEAGAALVRPGNGGSIAGVVDKPLLPQVYYRFPLPRSTTGLTITENTAARVTESLGPIPLQMGVTGLRCAEQVAVPAAQSPSPSPLAEPYPAKSWNASAQIFPDRFEIVLRIVPAQVAPDGNLTLFKKMEFNVEMVVPSEAAAITKLEVAGGNPVRVGQDKVPIALTAASDPEQPLRVNYEVWEASGALIGSATAIVSVGPAGKRVNVDVDGSGWSPGPKHVNVSIAGDQSGVLYDTRMQEFTVAGLKVALSMGSGGVAPNAKLPVQSTVRNESGALVGGLAQRFTYRIEGKPVTAAVTESSTGVYNAILPTEGVAPGVHTAEVQVSDRQGNQAGDAALFGIGSEWLNSIYLPALMSPNGR